MFKRLLVLGMVVWPILVAAEVPENSRLAREIAASEGTNVAFEKIQIFKDRLLLERQSIPGQDSKETDQAILPIFSLSDFQTNTLKEGELFLDSYAGGGQSLIFAVTKDACRLIELPGEEEMSTLLFHLYKLVSNVKSDQVELNLAVTKVSETLLKDLRNELQVSHKIILAPDGVFNLIPTCILLPGHDNVTFSRVPSASTFMEIRTSQGRRSPLQKPRSLAVGGVVEASGEFPGSYRELERMEDTYSGVTLVRPNSGGVAPELNKLMGFDLIHVAAQTIVDDRNARQSAIALDLSDPQMMIRAADLNGVKLDTRLVVLASCSSATGELLNGEGLQGLTTAFLATGVPAVVAALWPVDDDATGFFMAAFYEGLNRGNSADEALALARKKCQQNSMFNLPFHWGAFILIGEGQVQMPLELKSEFGVSGSWLLAVLAGIGAGFYFIFRTRR